jgi:hypothetical protein
MSDHNLIPASDHSAWMKALHLCGDYDIYHLPQYHLLAEKMREGEPYLFFFKRNSSFAALPFLLRTLENVEGLEGCQHNDISSVYGYPGIVSSIKEDADNAYEFKMAFQDALKSLFEQLSVVAFFSRTNPLLSTTWILKGMAEILPLSLTVAVDLSASSEKQLEEMTKGHKYDVRKSRRLGVVVEEDETFQHIDEFIQIYNETMKRTGARDSYFFPKDYYFQLKKSFGESLRLYFARLNGQAVSASMFFMTGRIIQYHLSGTPSEFFPLNGGKLILDEVRQIGARNGFSWLHLGGGVGSSEDNLYRFKAGFSKHRQPFEVARMIVDQEIYSELCEKRSKWARESGQPVLDNKYFPEYRAS